jgi:hypothetical protein
LDILGHELQELSGDETRGDCVDKDTVPSKLPPSYAQGAIHGVSLQGLPTLALPFTIVRSGAAIFPPASRRICLLGRYHANCGRSQDMV